LDRITLANDLGAVLDPRVKFIDHIYSSMVNKARGALGFIKRWSKKFDDPYIKKTSVISLVHLVFENGSPVWNSC